MASAEADNKEGGMWREVALQRREATLQREALEREALGNRRAFRGSDQNTDSAS
jgi:hypothetical protein